MRLRPEPQAGPPPTPRCGLSECVSGCAQACSELPDAAAVRLALSTSMRSIPKRHTYLPTRIAALHLVCWLEMASCQKAPRPPRSPPLVLRHCCLPKPRTEPPTKSGSRLGRCGLADCARGDTAESRAVSAPRTTASAENRRRAGVGTDWRRKVGRWQQALTSPAMLKNCSPWLRAPANRKRSGQQGIKRQSQPSRLAQLRALATDDTENQRQLAAAT